MDIPEGIVVQLAGFKVSVSGSNGSLEKDFFSSLFAKEIQMKKQDNKIIIFSESKKRKVKSMLGTIESHIKNMIKGVTERFTYKLKIVYMHFPITVKVSEREVLIQNFLGEKYPRKAEVVDDCNVEVSGDEITVSGINKESVGQTAANIEKATKISARDRRVFQDGIFLVEGG